MKINSFCVFSKFLHRFEKYFSGFMDTPFRYIFILDDKFPKRCYKIFITQLIKSCSKYRIQGIALGTKFEKELMIEYAEDFHLNLDITIVKFSDEDFSNFRNLYSIFPICNNLRYISTDCAARLLPEDISFEELLQIMLA